VGETAEKISLGLKETDKKDEGGENHNEE